MEMITTIKNIATLLLYIITLFCSYCYGQNEDITLNFKIKKKDVGKIEFRAPEKKYRAMKDMTSVVDSMWYVGDTLYVTYKQQTYQVFIQYHDGDTIYIEMPTTQLITTKKNFIQHLSVPQMPEYVVLNNDSHIFHFKRVSLREYQLIEYFLIDITEQNKIQTISSHDSIKRDDIVRPSRKLQPDPTGE